MRDHDELRVDEIIWVPLRVISTYGPGSDCVRVQFPGGRRLQVERGELAELSAAREGPATGAQARAGAESSPGGDTTAADDHGGALGTGGSEGNS